MMRSGFLVVISLWFFVIAVVNWRSLFLAVSMRSVMAQDDAMYEYRRSRFILRIYTVASDDDFIDNQ